MKRTKPLKKRATKKTKKIPKLKLPNVKSKTVRRRNSRSKGKQPPKEKSLFELFDEQDVQQIVNLQSGKIIKNPFYMVEVEGQGQVFGISYAGVIEIAKLQKHIKVSNFQRSDTEDSFVSVVSATDERTGLSILGCGVQGKFSNPFAQIISVSKAQRNAMRPLLYQQFIEKCFKAWYRSVFNTAPDMSRINFVAETDIPQSQSSDEPTLFEQGKEQSKDNAKKS